MYALPDYENVEEVVINKDVIKGNAVPYLVYSEVPAKGTKNKLRGHDG